MEPASGQRDRWQRLIAVGRYVRLAIHVAYELTVIVSQSPGAFDVLRHLL